MDSSLRHPNFLENLLRCYLGRYQNYFHMQKSLDGSVVLTTDPPPKLAITLNYTPFGVFIALSEWVRVEADDPIVGSCEFYSYGIVEIPVEDPDGFHKMEEQVARSLLSPS